MPHIHELYDFTVGLFIVHDNKVLLVEHPRYGKWLPVGGHVELDEDPEQAIHREAMEESGLTITLLPTSRPRLQSGTSKALPTPHYMDVHEANPPHKHIGLTYFAKADTSDVTLSDEHTNLRWFSENEITHGDISLPDDVAYYCTEALALYKSSQ